MNEQIENKFYTCKYDRAFKEIMLNEKNSDLLKWFLESILKIKINKIKIKPQERNTGNIRIKRKIFDALLETDIGKVQIEVNANIEEYIHPRNMAYISDVYSHDTLIGEIYNEEIMFLQINLTYGLKEEKEYREYMFQDKEGKLFIKNFKIYEFNMDYYKKIWENKNRKLIDEKKALIMLDLKLDELKNLSKKDRMVEKYMENIEKINKDPEFREYMSLEEDFRKIRNSRLASAKKKAKEEGLKEGLEEGKKEGLKEGIKEGIIKMARNMINIGMNIEDISKVTGLSIDEIKKLESDI